MRWLVRVCAWCACCRLPLCCKRIIRIWSRCEVSRFFLRLSIAVDPFGSDGCPICCETSILCRCCQYLKSLELRKVVQQLFGGLVFESCCLTLAEPQDAPQRLFQHLPSNPIVEMRLRLNHSTKVPYFALYEFIAHDCEAQLALCLVGGSSPKFNLITGTRQRRNGNEDKLIKTATRTIGI